VTEKALVVTGSTISRADRNLGAILAFFGIPYDLVPLDSLSDHVEAHGSGVRTYRILGSSDVLSAMLDENRTSPVARFLEDHVHSCFVYSGEDSAAAQRLVRRVSGDDEAITVGAPRESVWMTVTDCAEFCGPMSGVKIVSRTDANAFQFSRPLPRPVLSIIADDQGRSALLWGQQAALRILVCSSQSIVDLDDPIVGQNFDIREHLFSALPIAMYIKWAFPETCWKEEQTGACVVIDDPLLRPRYGHLRYRDLSKAMQTHNFASNVAFIPWNFRRSKDEVARLFREAPARFSLSVHGCDHTGAEFGSQDAATLTWKANTAIDRMDRHESITRVGYSKVMVFPQGVFSSSAMTVLRDAGFWAAVNTEVMSLDRPPTPVCIRDVWDVAVMNYDDFPIYTRRYPSQGIANFAFDVLLGKPCLVVIHHEWCRGNLKQLVEFIDRLNALQCDLKWASLGDVILGGLRYREPNFGTVLVEMYGTAARIRNSGDRQKKFVILRRTRGASVVREVNVGSTKASWDLSDGHLRFEFMLEPGEEIMVHVRFEPPKRASQYKPTLEYRFKSMLRRHLSEFRDNYLTR
jgi:hypothetical protein